MTDSREFESWLAGQEDERLEFKEAKNRFDFGKLIQYCVALANEGGGKLILGVTNEIPRRVVGSQAFSSPGRTKSGLFERLRLRINVEVFHHRNHRVLIFHVPARPIGRPIEYQGAYWMRSGEALVPMTTDQIKRILDESKPDFSAEICSGAVLGDLEPDAIAAFRSHWHRKSGNEAIRTLADEQLLRDSELIFDNKITYAALILFGRKEALGRYLGQAEVIFEYRSSDTSIPFQQRQEFREGFFAFFEDLWRLVNLRNDLQHFQSGLFVWDIPTFNEGVIREAILNAVSHRDYRLGGSVFVCQFPRSLRITSPGSLPEGITPENIVYNQNPRNRRIAEALTRCGLVERSGQGFDKIVSECIRESKPRPDFTGTDAHQVNITFEGTVQNTDFLRFLEQIGAETQEAFGVDDFQVLDLLSRGEVVPPGCLADRLKFLRSRGIVESVGRTRGTRYILSKRYYSFAGEQGAYTRSRGLDREHNKMLLLQHLSQFGGGRIAEFEQVLPARNRKQIHSLLEELKREGKVRFVGSKKGGHWEMIPRS